MFFSKILFNKQSRYTAQGPDYICDIIKNSNVTFCLPLYIKMKSIPTQKTDKDFLYSHS